MEPRPIVLNVNPPIDIATKKVTTTTVPIREPIRIKCEFAPTRHPHMNTKTSSNMATGNTCEGRKSNRDGLTWFNTTRHPVKAKQKKENLSMPKYRPKIATMSVMP